MSKHDNKGGLWRNQFKASDQHPDYVGEVTINGVTHKIAAWNDSTGNPKRPALNLVVTPVQTDEKDIPF